MKMIISELTVLFDDSFWVGIFEKRSDGRYEVCKVTFGTEPKDHEVQEFILNNWDRLRFSPSIEVEATEDKKISPKRMQRIIQKKTAVTGIGTKAQQALKLQQEEGKIERKIRSREEREEEKERQFELKQVKRKEKHRGH